MSSFYLAGRNTANPIPIGFLIPFQWFFPWCQAAYPYTCTTQFSTKHSREALCRSPEHPPFLPSPLAVLSCPVPSPSLLSSFLLFSCVALFLQYPVPQTLICFGLSEHPLRLFQRSPIPRCWVSVLQLTLAIKLQPS